MNIIKIFCLSLFSYILITSTIHQYFYNILVYVSNQAVSVNYNVMMNLQQLTVGHYWGNSQTVCSMMMMMMIAIQ